jgi:hypothetical protein
MMRFEILYKVEGTRKVIATVPDTHELPINWGDWTDEDKDEWIFNRQSSSEFVFEDIHDVKTISVEWQD